MKVWNKEVNQCLECSLFESIFSQEDIIYRCQETACVLTNPEKIHKECPFNKSINEKVIEDLGWIKSDEQILPKDIIGCYDFRNDINKEYHGVFRETHTTILRWDLTGMEYEWVQIFSGRLNNPEELKFILKRLNIIE